MRVIHLVRKPLSEGTVASNVLKHGTGAIHIDACRVPGPPKQATGAEWLDEGRWPANLVLQHRAGCRRVGTWACEPGCPIPDLDGQTGTLKSGVGSVMKKSAKDNQGNTSAAYGQESRPEGSVMVSYGDVGGASRFYKQVGGS